MGWLIKMNCRFCKSSNLSFFLDLEFQPIANNFLTEKQLNEPEIYYPLRAYLCNDCKLSQLGYVPPPEKIFNKDYHYEAGTTRTRREHHHSMAKSICEKFNLTKNSLVVDIGSNVGVLLEGFKSCQMDVVGVDASDNVAEIARRNGIDTITGFFGKEIGKKITLEKNKKAKVITATNVFAHIHDYDEFMAGIENLLDDDGIFVVQVHYFLDLVNKLQYDMIFHEHILFESVKPLKLFFERFGLELFDVERYDLDGGTIRCFVSKPGVYPTSTNISSLLKEEENEGIHDLKRLKDFANQVSKHRDELINLLSEIKKQGKKIVALSIPAKGVTLLNYCKIGTRILEYATEKTQLKIGKYSPGGHLPIKSDMALLDDQPDYALLLAWNFEKEIIANNQEFLNQGGKFIVPIPKPRIIEK